MSTHPRINMRDIVDNPKDLAAEHSQFLNVNGYSVHFQVFGEKQENGFDLILMHGGMLGELSRDH